MKRFLLLFIMLGLFGLVLLVPSVLADAEAQFQDFNTGQVIARSEAERENEGDTVKIKGETYELSPGYAYTVWAVNFNAPDECIGGCGPDDFDAGRGNVSVMWSGAGFIADDDGEGKFNIELVEGEAPGEVFFGDGLVDAEGTEIHLIIRCHGPASDDPDILEAQLTTFAGGCDTNECVDVQFSVLLGGDNDD